MAASGCKVGGAIPAILSSWKTGVARRQLKNVWRASLSVSSSF